MSYTPTEWKSGDTITSAKLNKMEQGIAAGGSGGGVLVVHATETEEDNVRVLDKTWSEIRNADFAVIVTEIEESGEKNTGIVQSTVDDSGLYVVVTSDGMFETDSENGYPQTNGK